MRQKVILDTGPLVAFLNSRDKYHAWSELEWGKIDPPFVTCEAVLSEACFLLGAIGGGQSAVIELLKRNIVHTPVRIDENIIQIGWLLKKYADIPMSFADACLVRMTELYAESPVLTLDTDFRIYRKNKTQMIPTIFPPDLK